MATMPGTQTRVDWQPQPAVSWQSDVALAYAIFRLTFGVNICFRGVADGQPADPCGSVGVLGSG